MKAVILLRKDHPQFALIQASLSAEIQALPREGIDVREVIAPPPEDTLVFGEVAQVIAQNKDAIVHGLTFLTAMIQLLRAVLERRNVVYKKPRAKATKRVAKTKSSITQKSKHTAIVIQVGKNTLKLPCSDQQAHSFIKKAVAAEKSTSKNKKR